MVRAFGLGAMLFGVWLLLSGHYTPLLLGFGVASSILVVLIAMRMDVVDREGVPLVLGPGILAYTLWLLREILRANIIVARIILDPALPISPVMVHYHASQNTDLGRVIYANSITLTPGTITTGVDGSELEIHALTRADIDGREEDEMDRRVTRLEQGI